MSRSLSRTLLAAVATVCLLLTCGCAGLGSKLKPKQPAKQAGEATESAFLTEQQTADMQLAMGRLAEQQQQWAQAMSIYRQVLQSNPKHPEATHRLAILHDRKGQFDQSAEWFQKTLKLKPGDPEVFCDIGYSLASQGLYQEAEINLRQALAIAPDHLRSHNHLGAVLAQRGQPDEALAAFARANCTPAQAHLNLAVVLAMNQRTAEAREHLQYAQSLQAGDPATQQRLQDLASWIADAGPPRPVASQQAPAAVASAAVGSAPQRLGGGHKASAAADARTAKR